MKGKKHICVTHYRSTFLRYWCSRLTHTHTHTHTNSQVDCGMLHAAVATDTVLNTQFCTVLLCLNCREGWDWNHQIAEIILWEALTFSPFSIGTEPWCKHWLCCVLRMAAEFVGCGVDVCMCTVCNILMMSLLFVLKPSQLCALYGSINHSTPTCWDFE